MKNRNPACTQCGRRLNSGQYLEIDGSPYCRLCIHGGAEPVIVYPIGIVRRNPGKDECSIELQPFMERFTHGLDEERHLTVVYLLHKSRGVKTTFNRRLDSKSVSVFASRTQNRPTPIAVSEVELVSREGSSLYVRGLDALDGSPVLDIKLGYRAIAS